MVIANRTGALQWLERPHYREPHTSLAHLGRDDDRFRRRRASCLLFGDDEGRDHEPGADEVRDACGDEKALVDAFRLARVGGATIALGEVEPRGAVVVSDTRVRASLRMSAASLRSAGAMATSSRTPSRRSGHGAPRSWERLATRVMRFVPTLVVLPHMRARRRGRIVNVTSRKGAPSSRLDRQRLITSSYAELGGPRAGTQFAALARRMPRCAHLLATFREGVQGSQADLTAIPLRRAVVLLATPIILEMSMESLFAIVDIFYVARLSSEAVTIVGLGETMLSPVYALAIGLSAGGTALVARRVGEKSTDAAAAAAGQIILVALACAACVGLCGALTSDWLLSALSADDELRVHGSRYAATLLGGSVTVFLLSVFNALFRSTGDAFVCMRALWLANGVNIVLAPILIFGLGPIEGLGVLGGAIATTSSRGLGVIYQLVTLTRGRSRRRLPFERRHLVPRPAVMLALLRLSGVATAQVLIETVSWLGLIRILATFGSLAVAGYTIAMRVTTFVLLPALGVASSVATLVGQNLGANQPGRARQALTIIATYNTVFLAVVGATLAAAPRLVLQFFTSDEEVIHYAEDCVRIIALGFVVLAQGMVTVQAFNGAGDVLTPMAIRSRRVLGRPDPARLRPCDAYRARRARRVHRHLDFVLGTSRRRQPRLPNWQVAEQEGVSFMAWRQETPGVELPPRIGVLTLPLEDAACRRLLLAHSQLTSSVLVGALGAFAPVRPHARACPWLVMCTRRDNEAIDGAGEPQHRGASCRDRVDERAIDTAKSLRRNGARHRGARA